MTAILMPFSFDLRGAARLSEEFTVQDDGMRLRAS